MIVARVFLETAPNVAAMRRIVTLISARLLLATPTIEVWANENAFWVVARILWFDRRAPLRAAL